MIHIFTHNECLSQKMFENEKNPKWPMLNKFAIFPLLWEPPFVTQRPLIFILKRLTHNWNLEHKLSENEDPQNAQFGQLYISTLLMYGILLVANSHPPIL